VEFTSEGSVKVHVINATKKAFGFADLTVGRSKMRLAA
jgi:hypothetical protein